MFEALRSAVAQLRQLVAEVEPDRCDGAGARTLVELFGEVERLGAAGKALAARQVVATGAWKHDGAHRDAASWLAQSTGATVGAARATVETAERLSELPATEAALRAGVLSFAQVDAITDAAAVDPAAEADLLERAQHDGVRGLRDACARVKAAACADEHAVRADPHGPVDPELDGRRRHWAHRHPRSGRLHRTRDGTDRTIRARPVRRGARRRSPRTPRRSRVRRDGRVGRHAPGERCCSFGARRRHRGSDRPLGAAAGRDASRRGVRDRRGRSDPGHGRTADCSRTRS